MKRIMSIFVLCLILLTLAACSGEGKPAEATQHPEENPTETNTEANQEKDPVVGIVFEDIYSNRKLVLNDDNTFTYGEYSGNWEKNDSRLTIVYTYESNGYDIQCKHTLEIVEDENGVSLLEKKLGQWKNLSSGSAGVLDYAVEFYEEAYASAAASKITRNIGETVSSDIFDLTIESAKLCYYASSTLNETFGQPKTEEVGIFAANKGRTLISLTFKITNNDRGSISLNDNSKGTELNWKLLYRGDVYDIRGFDLNDKDGSRYALSFLHAYVSSNDGATYKYGNANNYIIEAGKTIIVKLIGIAVMEPESLDDSFDIVVNLLNSEGGNDWYIYHAE